MPEAPEKSWSPQLVQTVLQRPPCPELQMFEEMGQGSAPHSYHLVIKRRCLLVPSGGVQACTGTAIFLLLCLLAWTSVLLTTSAQKSHPRVQGGFAGEQRNLRQAAKPSPWLHEGVTTTVCACWRAPTPASQPRLCVCSGLWGRSGGGVWLQLEGSVPEPILQASVVIRS